MVFSFKRFQSRAAHYDPLTGLPNRLLLNARLDHATDCARRGGGKLAVLYLELSDFKQVNETYGDAASDDLLKQAAQRFKARVREEDTIARLGGADFVVVAESIHSFEAVAALGESLLSCLARPFDLLGTHAVQTSACIGVSIFPNNGDTIHALMCKAEIAMSRARQEGSNRLSFYSMEMGIRAAGQLEMISSLRQAVDRREFTPFFQLRALADTGKIVGAEALIRWRHPKLGLLPPARFLPLAEQAGLMDAIGNCMLKEVARQVKTWIAGGIYPGVVSFNVSVKQFRDQNLPRLVAKVIEDNDIPPSLLALEITEQALTGDTEQARNTLADLKRIGVKIYLDDFGTGFSSFSCLSQFPIDVLKIDTTFIRNINRSPKDNQIVLSMIGIAHSMEMEVIAEGVETAEQAEFLRNNGCDKYQGHLLSPALPAEEYTAVAQRRNSEHEITGSLAACPQSVLSSGGRSHAVPAACPKPSSTT